MTRFTARLSLFAVFVALATLLLGIAVTTFEALAHHPGSHAVRQADGRIQLEAVATVTDGCTTIASVERGTPPGIRPPAGNEPVTARLQRPEGAICTAALTVARREAVLDLPASSRSVHLYVLEPNGSLLTTERVPIR